jgi:hypothetical protein
MVKQKKTNIKEIFLGLQDQMHSKLSLNKRILTHPVSKGDASELEWIDMLSTYLPKRYQVEKAIVIDCEGEASDQIDIVICDRQYSPFILRQNGATYVPAESVYAVIEVKPNLNKQTLAYASEKAFSVRRLKRTAAPIADARGIINDVKPPAEIFAGLIALEGSCSNNLRQFIEQLTPKKIVNFGCSLNEKAFWFRRHNDQLKFEQSRKGEGLLFFVLNLIAELQAVGTVSAIDLRAYMKNLK